MLNNPDSNKRPFLSTVMWLGACLVFGVLVDGASEGFKTVARGVSDDPVRFVDNVTGLPGTAKCLLVSLHQARVGPPVHPPGFLREIVLQRIRAEVPHWR